METWTWSHENVDKWTHGHGDIKQKTEAQAIFLYPFTVCSLCKRKFVRLLTKKQTEVIHLQMDYMDLAILFLSFARLSFNKSQYKKVK
jgi:hypothetical protein